MQPCTYQQAQLGVPCVFGNVRELENWGNRGYRRTGYVAVSTTCGHKADASHRGIQEGRCHILPKGQISQLPHSNCSSARRRRHHERAAAGPGGRAFKLATTAHKTAYTAAERTPCQQRVPDIRTSTHQTMRRTAAAAHPQYSQCSWRPGVRALAHATTCRNAVTVIQEKAGHRRSSGQRRQWQRGQHGKGSGVAAVAGMQRECQRGGAGRGGRLCASPADTQRGGCHCVLLHCFCELREEPGHESCRSGGTLYRRHTDAFLRVPTFHRSLSWLF